MCTLLSRLTAVVSSRSHCTDSLVRIDNHLCSCTACPTTFGSRDTHPNYLRLPTRQLRCHAPRSPRSDTHSLGSSNPFLGACLRTESSPFGRPLSCALWTRRRHRRRAGIPCRIAEDGSDSTIAMMTGQSTTKGSWRVQRHKEESQCSLTDRSSRQR